MEQVNKFSAKKLICSVVFNTIVLVLALVLFKPFFEEIDDTQIAMIVEGAFGVKEWHVIYPNFLLGLLYVFLQSVAPLIRWHVILQYVFVYVAYVMMTYVISKHKRGTAISIVAVLATFYEMYVSIQYTKSAAFVCVAGFILLFEYVRNKTYSANLKEKMVLQDGSNVFENRFFVITSFILITYGTLLRPEALFIAAVPAAAIGLLELFRTKNIVRYILVFVPAFALAVILHLSNSFVYSKDAGWDKFIEYNNARMQLNDYRYDIFDFTKYADTLADLEVSENDALAILTYQFGDDEEFSLERFLQIRQAFPPREFGYVTFANLYENLVREISKSYIIYAGAIGLLIILVASIVTDRSKSSPGFIKDSRRKLIAMVLMGMFLSAAIIYFQYSGRFSHRLLASILIPTLFLICYMIDSISIKDNNSKIIFGGNRTDITVPVGIVISLILIGLNVLSYFNNQSEWVKGSTENAPILREMDEMSKDKESLYIADTFTFQNVHKYEVFNTFEEGELDNFVTCGSWYLNSPITKRITNSYGYSNPFEALRLGKENIYLLDNQGVECKTLFLTEHYVNVYEAEKVETRGGIDVYRISEKQ